jgi:prolipoprotein diacylglyceryl transferase
MCGRDVTAGATGRGRAGLRSGALNLLAIPSPSDPFIFRFGGLQPRWYGLLLACGVLLAGWMGRREFRRRRIDPDLAYSIAVWTVPFGLVGARLYHVVTDWDAFWPHHLADVVKIWEGGLGIWGAVLGGMLGTWIACQRVRLPFWRVADCIAPGLILAQALGRWGNYANQELYGHPSSLPWAVKIDPAHRYAPYQADSTFQPMFLYESIWDALMCLVLLWFTRRYWRRVPVGTIFVLYVVLYDVIRLPLETMKIDPADHFFGQRVNVWVAAGTLIVALTIFVILFRRRTAEPPPEPVEASPAVAGHVPTARPEAAIAARRASQRRRRPG